MSSITVPSLFRFKTTLNPPPTTNSSSSSSLRFTSSSLRSLSRIAIRASSSSSPTENGNLSVVQSFARAAILIAATVSMAGKLSQFPARAQAQAPAPEVEKIILDEEDPEVQDQSDAVEGLESLLERKLESGEDEEALEILKRLVSVQPEWKFLMARLMSEMGQTESARKVFEEILAENPQSFEALFENALLMDRCGEGEAVIKRLEDGLEMAEENKEAQLIMAQIQFLQKNVEEALSSYQELAMEDPDDFRPYFCRGMIYSLLDKDVEANEQFAKYRALSPNKFEVPIIKNQGVWKR